MILLTASLVHPVYTFRYIVYCIPAAALLIGAAVAALGRYAGPAALVLVLVAGLQAQVAQRYPDGHGIDIRAADRIVRRHAQPGDALLNISAQNGPRKGSGERLLESAYPYGLARLRDISMGASPQQSATLGGTYAPASLIQQRLASVRRLWVSGMPARIIIGPRGDARIPGDHLRRSCASWSPTTARSRAAPSASRAIMQNCRLSIKQRHPGAAT